MLDSKGSIRDDQKDVISLFDFVTERKRTLKETEEFINNLAHEKYNLDCWSNGLGFAGRGTRGGHELRYKYKKFLRRNLDRMLRMYERMKKKRE